MINKLKKYHKDFELLYGATMFANSKEFDYIRGRMHSNFYDIVFYEYNLWRPNYSDMNGIYDIFMPKMLAFDVRFLHSKPWYFNLLA